MHFNSGIIAEYKVEIKKIEIRVNGKDVKLTIGMSISAEVKTGKRTIMEFFLSPVLVSLDESLKLR